MRTPSGSIAVNIGCLTRAPRSAAARAYGVHARPV